MHPQTIIEKEALLSVLFKLLNDNYHAGKHIQIKNLIENMQYMQSFKNYE